MTIGPDGPPDVVVRIGRINHCIRFPWRRLVAFSGALNECLPWHPEHEPHTAATLSYLRDGIG